jgi:hypothetical protein
VDFSNVEKREVVGFHEDAPVGYCGLTQGQSPSSTVCIQCHLYGGSTGCVSESGDFATMFFFSFGNTGADSAFASLLPTLKRFSCNGAVDWSTKCFAVKVFYKNGDSFVIAQRKFQREFGIHRNRAVQSAHAIKTWVRNLEATASTLKKKGGCVKSI